MSYVPITRDNTLVVIPAREGSSRIPQKNRQEIDGVSLTQMAVNCADCINPNNIVVSSDAATPYWTRARHHFRDQSISGAYGTIEQCVQSVLHWLGDEIIDFDYVMTLQPAVICRGWLTIDGMMCAMNKLKTENAITVCKVTPWLWTDTAPSYRRSQDMSTMFCEVNSVQIAPVSAALNGKRRSDDYVLLAELPPLCISYDIDWPEDLAYAHANYHCDWSRFFPVGYHVHLDPR